MISPESSGSGSVEAEPTRAEQLHEACVDLRLTMRAQVKKSLSMHRARHKHEKAVRPFAEIRPVPTPKLMRELLRQANLVPAGTGVINGRMARHYHRVFEDDPSVGLPDESPRAHILVTHVTHRQDHKELEQLQYQIAMDETGVSVYEGALLLSEGDLGPPLEVIRRARQLYPE